MIRLSRKHLFYLTPLLIILIAALPASGAGDTNASGVEMLSINGTAFLDENSDTFFSAGERGLANVSLRLMQGDVEVAFAATEDTGEYIFANLTPGDYAVVVESADLSALTAPASGRYEVTLADLPAYFLDFGFSSPGEQSAARSLREYPIMRPTEQTAAAWSMQFNASDKAYISPEVSATLASYPPLSFSLLDQLEYTPSERDQGNCGNCWAWAGTGVMEIDYARQMGLSDRFSVQYLNSNFNGGCGFDGACCGGWLSGVADFYRSWKIIVPWNNTNAHYCDGATYCGLCSPVSASSISTSTSYPLETISAVTIPSHGLTSARAIENIKNVLLQGKAIWFAFFLPDSSSWNSFFSFWGSQQESAVWKPDSACGRSYSFSQGGGHAVLCVGYNDTDPKNRYWIMLNSWGDTPGRPAGLFRVNMNMNYNCAYGGLGSAFYWMTLDMSYPEDENKNSPPDTPSVPQGPAQGAVGAASSYSASANDGDGDPVTITFDWKDGATTEVGPVASGQAVTAAHSWSGEGSYAVAAKATDGKGASSGWSEPLDVTISSVNRPPAKPVAPQGPATGRASRPYSFSSSSTDPDGDAVSLVFDWGDSSQNVTAISPSGQTVSASHIWANTGRYSLRVRAEDGKGGVSPWSSYAVIRISSAKNSLTRKPSTPSGASAGLAGKSYFYQSRSTDPDQDRIYYTFDWGDGSSQETDSLASGALARAGHSWSRAGTYQIRIKATDSSGEDSLWSSSKKVKIYVSARGNARDNSTVQGAEAQPEKKSCGCRKN